MAASAAHCTSLPRFPPLSAPHSSHAACALTCRTVTFPRLIACVVCDRLSGLSLPLLPPPAVCGMSGSRAKGKATGPARSSLDVDAVEELLGEVPASFHTAREFNPFSHYDDSVDELTGYSDAVREAIELVVDAHYKGFNQATAAFTHVVQHFKTAQSNVTALTASLADSRRLVTARNDRLRDQWRNTQTLTHINHSLAKLTYLVTLPAHMAVLEERKQFLHCVILISHTLALLSSEDMREVEGLLELREDTISRRNNIVDALLLHTQQLLYHKHRQNGTAQSSTSLADADDGNLTGTSRASVSGDGSRSRGASPHADGLPQAAADGAATSGGPHCGPPAPSASVQSSSTSTMAFLTSNVLSPFHPSNCQSLDFALPADSSVLSNPAWRSISHLLLEERSPAFVAAPFAQPNRALSLVVAALDHINALPSAKLQLSRAVRQEVTNIIHDIKQHIRRHSGGKRRKRIVAENGQAAGELSPSFRPLSSHKHTAVAPLSPAALPLSNSSAASSAQSRSSTSLVQSSRPTEPSTALPRVSSSDRSTLTDMLARVFAALMSALRMHSQLIHITAMVQRARRDMQAAADATQLQQQPADKRKAVGKKEAGAADREDSRWSLLHVWATMQIELQVLLQELLLNSGENQLKLSGSGAGSGSSAGALDSKAGKKGSADELDLTFSFDDASAPSIARMSRGKDNKSLSAHLDERRQHQAALRREQRAIVPPSPYNITLLYRPVEQFCRQVQQLCQASVGRERDVSDASAQLLAFLSVFVHSSFLPRLQADVNIRVDAILAEEHAFDEWQAPSEDASQQSTATLVLAFFNHAYDSRFNTSLYVPPSSPTARVHCVVGVCDLVLSLLSDAGTLPSFAAEYVSVVDSALNRLQTACHDKYVDVGRGVYSANRLKDSTLVAALEHEQPYVDIIMQEQQQQGRQHDSVDTPSPPPSSSFSASTPLYAPFFATDFSLRQEQLMSDSRNVAQICLLHSSLEWLCDQLYSTAREQHQQSQRCATLSTTMSADTQDENATVLRRASVSLDGEDSTRRLLSFRLDAQQLKEEARQPVEHNHKATADGHTTHSHTRPQRSNPRRLAPAHPVTRPVRACAPLPLTDCYGALVLCRYVVRRCVRRSAIFVQRFVVSVHSLSAQPPPGVSVLSARCVVQHSLELVLAGCCSYRARDVGAVGQRSPGCVGLVTAALLLRPSPAVCPPLRAVTGRHVHAALHRPTERQASQLAGSGAAAQGPLRTAAAAHQHAALATPAAADQQ